MEISHYDFDNLSELEAAIWEYNEQVKNGIIFPRFAVELDIELFTPDDCLIIEKKSEKIRGFLKYALNRPSGIKELDEMKQRDFENAELRGYSPETVATIKFMESFQKGTGRALMNALKSRPGIEGIYLVSFRDSEGFYRNMEFETVGYMSNKKNPIMVWKRCRKT